MNLQKDDLTNFPRRSLLRLAAATAIAPAFARVAWAQAYPSRPVRLVVGFAAGGPLDIVARLMGQWLSERLGQQFVIENRAGGGGNVATEAVVNAPPDGYTLLMVSPSNTVNTTLYEKLSFNFIRDIAPVAGIMRTPNVMVVRSVVPREDGPGVHRLCQGQTRQDQHGLGRQRTSQHVAGELFKMMARHQHGACALSRLGAGAHRSLRWTGARHVRDDA